MLNGIIDKKKGITHDIDLTFAHIVEELEVAHYLNNSKLKRITQENISDEVADMFIFLSKLAQLQNINIEDAVRKMEKDKI